MQVSIPGLDDESGWTILCSRLHSTSRRQQADQGTGTVSSRAQSQPRCRQPSSRVPVSLGRKFPPLQNGLLRQLAATRCSREVAARGRGLADLTCAGLGNLAIFDPPLHTSALPCPRCLSPGSHPHNARTLQPPECSGSPAVALWPRPLPRPRCVCAVLITCPGDLSSSETALLGTHGHMC